jgi:hypothetical protein
MTQMTQDFESCVMCVMQARRPAKSATPSATAARAVPTNPPADAQLAAVKARAGAAYLDAKRKGAAPPAGTAMFQMLGVFAQFERAMIQERVRAGLARARGEGKRLGRPGPCRREPAIRAAPSRPGVRAIAARFKVNPSTVQRISAEMS